jgi:hypothetical protein
MHHRCSEEPKQSKGIRDCQRKTSCQPEHRSVIQRADRKPPEEGRHADQPDAKDGWRRALFPPTRPQSEGRECHREKGPDQPFIHQRKKNRRKVRTRAHVRPQEHRGNAITAQKSQGLVRLRGSTSPPRGKTIRCLTYQNEKGAFLARGYLQRATTQATVRHHAGFCFGAGSHFDPCSNRFRPN